MRMPSFLSTTTLSVVDVRGIQQASMDLLCEKSGSSLLPSTRAELSASKILTVFLQRGYSALALTLGSGPSKNKDGHEPRVSARAE